MHNLKMVSPTLIVKLSVNIVPEERTWVMNEMWGISYHRNKKLDTSGMRRLYLCGL